MTAGKPSPSVPALLTRSTVTAGLHYGEYRQTLRHDFYYSCAYCTMSEDEAHGIAFEIDHYEPQRARPDLENDYGNLMYSCSVCNNMKGDLSPPQPARADSYRFFRPDQDDFNEHFRAKGVTLASDTNVGKFSIDFLELNRLSLRKIREIRERLAKAAPVVSEQVLSLRNFKIDQLPPNVRALAVVAIRRARAAEQKLTEDIDTLLREFARSSIVDPDPDSTERSKVRAAESKKLRSLYAGSWRARRT
jgi:hypothetical protein